MSRRFWVRVHRFAGLYLAVFLTVAGLTGSILAFDRTVRKLLNPGLVSVPVQDRPSLDAFSLRERALALHPGSRINFLPLNTAPGDIVVVLMEPPVDASGANSAAGGYQMLYFNPYSGEEIAKEDSGSWPVTRMNFIRFVFSLHSTLAAGRPGEFLFGIAALIWTFDCFVGLGLTFPRPISSGSGRADRASENARSWFVRWMPSWRFVFRGQLYRISFNLHRASGLWTWAFLLIFATSSVCFNLPEVYQPVMKVVFRQQDALETIPDLPEPILDPQIGWREAAEIGHKLASEQAQKVGLKLYPAPGETYFMYNPAKGIFSYQEHGNWDVGSHTPAITVFFDGKTGAYRGANFASGQNLGVTITSWISAIHGATVGEPLIDGVVALVGVVTAVLSITGVHLWWKKQFHRKGKPGI